MGNVTIGCDPEMFLFDKEKGRTVPAVGLIPGTKSKPWRLTHGSMQLDGLLLEIGTDPAHSADEFRHNLRSVMSDVRSFLRANYGDRYELQCGAVTKFAPEDCEAVTEKDLSVGCESQYTMSNEGSLRKLDMLSDSINIEEVCAGGHLHIGFSEKQDIYDPVWLRSVAMFLRPYKVAIGSVVVDSSKMEITRFNNLFSRGLFNPVIRIKPYGFEFRNFSSKWLTDPNFYKVAFNTQNDIYSYLVQTKGQPKEDTLCKLANLLACQYTNAKDFGNVAY